MSSIVQIKDSAYDGLQSLRVYGKTVQNLWVNPSGAFTENGMTITPNSDGSITVNGTSTSPNLIEFKKSYALKPGTQYTFSVDKLFPVNGSDSSGGFYIQRNIPGQPNLTIAYLTSYSTGTITFTVPANTKYCAFGVQVIAGATVSGTYRVMLNEGSTAQPWCPPGLNSVGQLRDDEKNLWVNPSGTRQGQTCTPNDDGSFTISGVGSGEAFNIDSARISLTPGKRYMLSVDRERSVEVGGGASGTIAVREFNSSDIQIAYNRVGGKNQLSNGFTVKDDTAYATCAVIVGEGGSTGTYKVMLDEGSTAQPWVAPGTESAVQVVTAGKNLFASFQNTFQIQGENISNQIENIGTKDKEIPIGSKVIFSFDYRLSSGGGSATIQQFTSPYKGLGVSYSALSGDNIWHKKTGSVVTLDTDDMSVNTYQLRLDNVTGLLDVKNFQLELGSTATDYEPPNITITPINLQGHTLNSLPDGTRDELHIDGGGNVVLEKRTWSDVFDGTENWIDNTTGYGLDYGTTFATTADSVVHDKQLADTLPVVNMIDGVTGIRAYSSRWVDAFITSMSGDLAGFKAWLGNNNTTLIYKLAEPQTIDLGTVDLPKLRKKPLVNTIWANGTAEGTGFSLAPEIDCEYNRWSTYCDGFKTNGKHSYFDMGCCIAARDTGTPEKKSVTATVPYMSGFYDLSKLYGAIAFEARQLMYRLEFVEDSREELQQKKSQFLEWLSQVHDEEIADDDIPGRHFIGSLSEWEFEEGEEGQSGSLEVTFNCQPFLEADMDTTATLKAGANTVTVKGQPVNAYAKCASGTATIQIGGVTQSVGTSEIRLSIQLQPGDNAVTVTGSPVVLRWKELTA